MRLVHVVGTRPQLIKVAALLPALRGTHEQVLVDTGQHWDERMAGAFFAELELPRPDHTLHAGGGSDTSQIARMLTELEPVLIAEHPDAVVVYGDTNSTLAGALTAAKLRIPIAHIEAGMRSFDRRMPEELNRVLVDHVATWGFAATATAVTNFEAEGIRAGVIEVGDLMQDLASRLAATILGSDALRQAGEALVPIYGQRLPGPLRPGGFVFATIHRAENRAPDALAAWSQILAESVRPGRPVLLALHPGTRAALESAGITLGEEIHVVEPLGYRTSLTLQLYAAAVLTDSGGIQREASWLGTPCVVLRSTTEWVEAVGTSDGRMVVAGLDGARVRDALDRLAPTGRSEADARERVRNLALPPAGAGERIRDSLGADVYPAWRSAG